MKLVALLALLLFSATAKTKIHADDISSADDQICDINHLENSLITRKGSFQNGLRCFRKNSEASARGGDCGASTDCLSMQAQPPDQYQKFEDTLKQEHLKNSLSMDSQQLSNNVAKKVARVLNTKFKHVGDGFESASVSPSSFFEKMNPFLNVDHFYMAQPFFPPHPHAGFCPVTFLFEDSKGSFKNRDTVNKDKTTIIAPGDIFWSTAGSGLIHEETPVEPGKSGHGLQIFVNLATANREVKPRHDHLEASKVPIVNQENGVRVRVVVGDHAGLSSPLKPLTPVALLDVTVPKGATFRHSVPSGWNSFALMIKGAGKFADTQVGPQAAVGFESEGDSVEFEAAEDSNFILFSGEPINDPTVFGGSFIGSSREQLMKFQQNYALGKMGQLSRSF